MGAQRIDTSAAALCACVLLALAALPSSASVIRQFNETGSYTTGSYSKPVQFVLPSHTRVGVQVTITYPTSPSDDGSLFPLLIAFNGFMCQAKWYEDTVQRAASWGYVVFQYTVDGKKTEPFGPGDREEFKYLQPLLDWLVAEAANASTPIYGQVDFDRKAVLGHSRGGKLATWHYARRTDLTTAVLLDPVDCGHDGPDYPSAITALGGIQENVACGKPFPQLTRSTKTAAVIGAEFVSPFVPCNPRGTNYLSFLSVLAPGSWQILIKKAGHMQFAFSTDTGYTSKDFTCGPWFWAKIDTEGVIQRSRTIAVAWLQNTFRPAKSVEQMRLFESWISDQVQSDILTFRTTDLTKDNSSSEPVDALEDPSGSKDCGSAGGETCSVV